MKLAIVLLVVLAGGGVAAYKPAREWILNRIMLIPKKRPSWALVADGIIVLAMVIALGTLVALLL